MPQDLSKKNKTIPNDEFDSYIDAPSVDYFILSDKGQEWCKEYIAYHIKDIDYIFSLIYLTMANVSFFVDEDSDIYRYAQKVVRDSADYGTILLQYLIRKVSRLSHDIVTEVATYQDSSQIPDSSEDTIWRYVGGVAYVMLNIKDGDKILDLSVEKQGFTYDALPFLETYNYYDDDEGKIGRISRTFLDRRQAYLAKMFVAIMSKDVIETDFIVGDPLNSPSSEYNKAFVYPPVGQHQAIRKMKYSSILYPDIKFTNPFHEQWIYVDRMLSGLKGKDVRAVALLYGRSLMQAKENEFLQRLISDGWIESIIEMPTEDLVKEVGSIPYFVIFSQNNKETSVGRIDYIDDFGTDLERFLSLNELKVPTDYGEVDLLEKDFYSISTLKDMNILIPSKMSASRSYKKSNNGKTLVKDVAEVFVSTQYTINDFDKSKEPTGYKLLTSKDISNSQIQWDNLESIVMTKSLFDKYALHEGDVVITNKTTNVKSAVVDIVPTEKVIAANSAIVVRPNKERLDPVYFKIFLDSEDAKTLLMASQTGSSNYNFTQSFIENLEIPMVDLEKQKAKAEKYLGMVSSINAYRDCINKLETEMSYLIDDEED